MRARLGETTIAEADDDDLVRIEGNWYFPPAAVDFAYLGSSDTPYTCPWKGRCRYYSVTVDGTTYPDRAWTYPQPLDTAIATVGHDFTGYVAFWKEVEVTA